MGCRGFGTVSYTWEQVKAGIFCIDYFDSCEIISRRFRRQFRESLIVRVMGMYCPKYKEDGGFKQNVQCN